MLAPRRALSARQLTPVARRSPFAATPLAGLAVLLLLVGLSAWFSTLAAVPAPGGLQEPSPAALWMWDGSGYSLRDAPPGPSLAAADSAADTSRGEIVLWEHGCAKVVMGFTGGCKKLINRTWTWGGRAWRRRQPRSSPSEAGPGSMFYSGVQRAVLYVNGRGMVWSWHDSDWQPQIMPGAPHVVPAGMPSRVAPSLFAAGYEEERELLIFLFSDSTWAWTGQEWKSFPGGVAYSDARPDAHLVYDRAHHNLAYAGRRFTWRWEGNRWHAAPQPEFGDGSLAYDPRGRELMFVSAGECSAGRCPAVTWFSNGLSWSLAQTSPSPQIPIAPGSLPPPIVSEGEQGPLLLFAGAG